MASYPDYFPTGPVSGDSGPPTGPGSGLPGSEFYQGGPVPAGYSLGPGFMGQRILVPIPGYQAAHANDYLHDIQNVYGAAANANIHRNLLASDIYGGDDPLARQYGRLSAINNAQEAFPGLIAQAVQAHHQMKDQQAWDLYKMQLAQAYAKANQPKHDFWGDILGLGGTIGGALLGGPAGAMAGYGIGSHMGGGYGGGYSGGANYQDISDYYGQGGDPYAGTGLYGPGR